ncbi:MAG: hypothetical protein ACR2QT_08255 [Woeseiaceae bacterium]
MMIRATTILILAMFSGLTYSSDVDEESRLHNFLLGKHVLFSYRDGGAIYGTYYFYDTHHCPAGRYIDYGSSSKQSVLGGEINNSWQDSGSWQVVTYEGQTGAYYVSVGGEETFLPMQLNADGSVYINDTMSFVTQGIAQCQ